MAASSRSKVSKRNGERKPFMTPRLSSKLQGKNVFVFGRRTSVRLENEMWDALQKIAVLRGVTVHDICSEVYKKSEMQTSFSSALRIYLLKYFRDIAEGKSKHP